MGERLRKMRRELLENGCYQCHSEHWVFILLLFAFIFFFFFQKPWFFSDAAGQFISVSTCVGTFQSLFSSESSI